MFFVLGGNLDLLNGKVGGGVKVGGGARYVQRAEQTLGRLECSGQSLEHAPVSSICFAAPGTPDRAETSAEIRDLCAPLHAIARPCNSDSRTRPANPR